MGKLGLYDWASTAYTLFMSRLRLLLLPLIAGLLVAQLPASGSCQMSFGMPAMMCSMPCCKNMPMTQCPMMKSAPSKSIATILPKQVSLPTLQILANLFIQTQQTLQLVKRNIHTTPQTYFSAFSPPGLLVRAPPLDIFTYQA